MPGTVVSVESTVVNQTHTFTDVTVAAVEGSGRVAWEVTQCNRRAGTRGDEEL